MGGPRHQIEVPDTATPITPFTPLPLFEVSRTITVKIKKVDDSGFRWPRRIISVKKIKMTTNKNSKMGAHKFALRTAQMSVISSILQ